MKFKNFVIFLTLSLLIFGCNDLKNRYDPVEASRNIFKIRDFVFYQWDGNNPPLLLDAWGKVDNDNYTITVPYPPSVSLTAAPLTARFRVENVGLDGGGDFELSLNRYWNDSPTITLNPKEFGHEYKEEPLYETKYDVIMESLLTINLSPNMIYQNINGFTFSMDFNDNVNPTILGVSAFITGFGDTVANNYNTLNLTNFTPMLTSGVNHYNVNITAVNEGYIHIRFASGSVQHESVSINNDESNNITFLYDATAPNVGSITVSGLDVSPTTTPVETVLSLSFPPSSDNFTSGSELYYEVYTSDTAGSLTNFLTSSYGYPSDLVFSYGELDSGTQTLLTGGTTVFVNVLVRDLAGNQVQYIEGSQLYTGSP